MWFQAKGLTMQLTLMDTEVTKETTEVLWVNTIIMKTTQMADIVFLFQTDTRETFRGGCLPPICI